jgi:hypothetical protein
MAAQARRRGGQAAFAQQGGAAMGQASPQQAASAQFIHMAMPMVPGDVYWRMGKGAVRGRTNVNAAPTAIAHGNSVVRSDPRGEPAARPGTGAGHGIANHSPYPVAQVQTPHSLDSAGMHARTAAFQHSRLIARDRHIISKRGRTSSSADEQRTGGSPNPEKDGPARPSHLMFNRSLSFQHGTDSTRNLDNNDYHAAVLAGGRKFPLATQGDEWSRVYGGTRYLANYRPYGTRGGFGEGAPLPTVRAEPGGPYLPRTLLQEGDPADGPQKVYGGLPWGLHSPTLTAQQQTQPMIRSRFMQVKPVRQNRPQNSRVAGQSWSQSMVSLSGQQAVKLTTTPPSRQPGLNGRWLGN